MHEATEIYMCQQIEICDPWVLIKVYQETGLHQIKWKIDRWDDVNEIKTISKWYNTL